MAEKATQMAVYLNTFIETLLYLIEEALKVPNLATA